MMESVQTINSAVRTALAAIIVAGGSFLGWTAYKTYNAKEINAKRLHEANEQMTKLKGDLDSAKDELKQKDVALADSERKIAALNEDIERKETALRLIKTDHRLAKLTVVDQTTDADTEEVTTKIEFVDVNDEGQPIDKPRTYQIKGDIVYVDALVVSFGDEFVEAGDPLRGTALCSFRRIFGERQPPAEGFPLDEVGTRPQAYGKGGQISDFEKEIWREFWNIASNRQLADKYGIKDANGRAPYIKAQKGKTYRITLRSTGDLTIKPE